MLSLCLIWVLLAYYGQGRLVCMAPLFAFCDIIPPSTNGLLLHPFNGLFSRTTWVSRYQKGKTSLDLNEARDDGILGCGGISWTICKRSAPRSRQITTPTPDQHHHQCLQCFDTVGRASERASGL